MQRAFGMVVVFTLLVAAIASAQRGEGPGPMRQGSVREPDRAIMERLHLTKEQRADLKATRMEMEKTLVKIQSDITVARIDMRELFTAGTLDRPAIEKKIKEISSLQLSAKMAIVSHLFEIYAKLTPEQQEIFKAHMEERAAEGMMGGGPGQMMKRGREPR